MRTDTKEYESPRVEIIIENMEDIVTSSEPDFDGGQSGLNF